MNNIDGLIETLDKNVKELYSTGEKNEILFSLYSSIKIALRTRTVVMLVIMPEKVLYYGVNNDEILIFPSDDSDSISVQTLSNLEVLSLILSKDSVVANILNVVSKDKDRLWCTIKRLDE